ncbi:hypothetical protein VP01_7257g1 [Puccinia sorghi]|uniref:Uncharacterized protein n=1 Tax=Puccinia sorghi TaxID=27349 RepID=A0A0L6UD10_9BASI|nr:hypothetical protein VP01_7257g1 [Puccinia sorghi]
MQLSLVWKRITGEWRKMKRQSELHCWPMDILECLALVQSTLTSLKLLACGACKTTGPSSPQWVWLFPTFEYLLGQFSNQWNFNTISQSNADPHSKPQIWWQSLDHCKKKLAQLPAVDM